MCSSETSPSLSHSVAGSDSAANASPDLSEMPVYRRPLERVKPATQDVCSQCNGRMSLAVVRVQKFAKVYLFCCIDCYAQHISLQ